MAVFFEHPVFNRYSSNIYLEEKDVQLALVEVRKYASTDPTWTLRIEFESRKL